MSLPGVNRAERRAFERDGHRFQQCPVCRSTVDTFAILDAGQPLFREGQRIRIRGCSEECLTIRAKQEEEP